MTIGRRLTLAFSSVAFVIICGAVITRWEFAAVLREAQTLQTLDDQVVAVYRIRADLETLLRRLENNLDKHDPLTFAATERSLRQNVFSDIQKAEFLLGQGNAPVPEMLRALRSTLETQFEAIERLSEVEDWTAIGLRLNNQVDAILENVREMVSLVNVEVTSRREVAVREMQMDQAGAQLLLAATAMVSLLIAAGLGLYVTRTIVKPLAKLGKAAHQLANGDFHIEVDVHSKDEFGEVGHAFSVAAAKLNESYKALQFSNESLEQFAYAASHDLQEPIRTISLLADLIRLRHAGTLDLKGKEHLKHLSNAAARMRELVVGTLEYSRLTSVDGDCKSHVDMHQVLNSVLENIRVSITETAAVISCGTLPSVCGNRVQLTQLFQNLISNAIKYRSEDPPNITVTAREDGPMARFCIEDNGIGIEPQYHEQVFGIFKQLNRDSEGVGMGLALTKRILERHGGTIWVHSAPGTGSRFYFTLKLVDSPSESRENNLGSEGIPADVTRR